METNSTSRMQTSAVFLHFCGLQLGVLPVVFVQAQFIALQGKNVKDER